MDVKCLKLVAHDETQKNVNYIYINMSYVKYILDKWHITRMIMSTK